MPTSKVPIAIQMLTWRFIRVRDCRSFVSAAQKKKYLREAALSLFELRAAKKRQDEQVDCDVHKQTGKHRQTKALGWRKFGQDKDGKPGADDHIGINNSAP